MMFYPVQDSEFDNNTKKQSIEGYSIFYENPESSLTFM